MGEEREGLILHLQRFSTEDGPGIRTTVFFKGCSLQCWWCHNPESLSSKPQVHWLEDRCISCETCVGLCPNGCLSMTDRGLLRDRELCEVCLRCVEACPANAMQRLGRWVGVEEVLHELLKDRAFYESSGGGITLSGGEPALQPVFVVTLLRELKEAGVQTALDTCGMCSTESLERILPNTDLLLFDLKEMDSEKHREFTGQGNQRILENLLFARDFVSRYPNKKVWVRTPIIPGATASSENVMAIGRFIADNMNGIVERWELCAFNNLCADKYRRLDMHWRYDETPLLTEEELQRWENFAKSAGVDPAIVIATGATQVLSL
ncbi:MAG: glycyl-radical enzyme activating protein [Anaerolineales bacterium]|nr:glycyl-radical enzyme activating protein [Anaerolineales bacterium]